MFLDEKNLVIEIKHNYAINDPDFYRQGIYNKKSELFFIEELEYSEFPHTLCSPTPFGWNVWEYFPEKEKHTRKSIVQNSNEYLLNNAPLRIYDKNNNLNYVIHKRVMRCDKVGKNASEQLWMLKMPEEFHNMDWCSRVIDNQIIAFNTKYILIVDTVIPKVTAVYSINNLISSSSIINVIPQNNNLWVVVGEVSGAGIFYYTYVIDLLNDNFYKLDKLIDYVLVHNKSIVLKYVDEIFVFDDKLALKSNFKISDIHKGALVKDEYYEYKSETDIFTFFLGNTKYKLNIDNPQHLMELPNGLESLNYANNGDNWDYCFIKEGNCYGYDIEKQETTWKIKTETIPSYSSELGVLTVDTKNKKIIAYGEKK
jgi:hypothetical protein